MAYREPVPEALRDRFWYGPFRSYFEVLVFWFLFVILAVTGVSTLRESNRLDCQRTSGQCSYRRTNLVGTKESVSFAIADVKDVQYVAGTGKNQSSGESLVVFRSGGNLRLPSLSADEARAQHGRLERFLEAGEGADLLEAHETSLWKKVATVALALVTGGAAVSALLHFLPFRVEVFERHVFVARERRRIDTTRVSRIIVETSPEKPKPRRVAFLLRDGEVDFLSQKWRGGWSTHEIAAARIGKLLDVPVDLDGRIPDDEPEST